jgi:hypothetical protein
MILRPKATRSMRLPSGPPQIDAFLADEAASRRRETPTRVETDLAALIARRRAGRSGKGEGD